MDRKRPRSFVPVGRDVESYDDGSSMAQRRRGVFTAPVCPRASEEDSYIKGDSTSSKLSRRPGLLKQRAGQWESAPTLPLSEPEIRKHQNLHLKTVFMLSKWGTQSPQTTDGKEDELLEACEIGDLIRIKALLSGTERVNVNCVDILGRTPLMIAVEKDNLQMIDVLISRSNKRTMDTVLLHAINQCKETIATAILRHPSYVKSHKVNLKRLGTNVGILDGDFPMTSNFYLDTTPIILASQKNLFSVVKLLLLRGESIARPHPACCSCNPCDRRVKRDRLRFAYRRLNTYRGLASESYITLASQDPFAEAFDLRLEVMKLSHYEKYFKEEYMTLAQHLGQYVVRLLNEVRSSNELDMVLDKVDGQGEKEFESLARMRRAIHIGMKKFVTHPSCQMKLTELWYSGARPLQRTDWLKRLFIFAVFIVVYPFMAILFLFIPHAKFLQVLRSPAVRFTAQAYSFLIFLTAIAGWSLNYDPGSTVDFDFQGHNVSHLFRTTSDAPGYITREYSLDGYEIVIVVWSVGLMWMKCEDLYRRGLIEHFSSVYNVLDMLMITLYTVSFALACVVVVKCNQSLDYFFDEGFTELSKLNNTAVLYFYWISPDRYLWDYMDPEHLSEASFAVANILTFSRISYLLAANEILGPLQISLGRMTYDILRFTVLFLIILVAFMVGIDNLLWHYETSMRAQVQIKDIVAPKVGENFGNVEKTFRSVFWVTFGLVEYDIIDMYPYTSKFTQHLAYILLGAYMVAAGLVMLNMLIAMMNRSFDQIARDGDIEFKFARSKLYLEYIEGGSPLPIPLNMLPTSGSFIKFCYKLPGIGNLLSRKDSLQVVTSGQRGKSSYRRYKKSSSKAIFAEVQYLSYQDVIKKIVDRFISEITRKDDDDTDTQNTTEMVKHEIMSLKELVKSQQICSHKGDNSDEIKGCLSQLTTAIDRFILLQEESSKLLKQITDKVENDKESQRL